MGMLDQTAQGVCYTCGHNTTVYVLQNQLCCSVCFAKSVRSIQRQQQKKDKGEQDE